MAHLTLGSHALRPAKLGRASAVVAFASLLSLASTQAISPSHTVPWAAGSAAEPLLPEAANPDFADTALAAANPDANPADTDPVVMLAVEARTAWREAVLGWAPQPVALPHEGQPSWLAALTPAEAPESPAAQEAMLAPQRVPLPMARPPEFRRPGGPSVALRPTRRSETRTAAAPPAAMEDTRTFFETLFGIEKPAAPALAYAALERPGLDPAPRRPIVPAPIPVEGVGTAVYDISARAVVLPSGERLEAHSGLGDTMDDPRYVHVPMRGATPPGTYDLTEREALFHGVRAIRLSPVGGPGAIHGRVGLLAHTFMLGPSGASNGCVSFRDYDKFLQAYLRGEIQRLVVVAGRGRDAGPQIASR